MISELTARHPLGTRTYRARHPLHGQVVVRTVESARFTPPGRSARRVFERAVHAWQVNRTSGLPTCLDAGEDPGAGTHWVMMRYERGQTLAGMLGALRRPLSVDETIEIVRPILETLTQLHDAGTAHGRLATDRVILRDTFAPVTKPVALAAPDVTGRGDIPLALKDPTDSGLRHADLYAAAALAVQASGYGDSTARRATRVHPKARGEWPQLLRRALASDPTERFETAEDFHRALGALGIATPEAAVS